MSRVGIGRSFVCAFKGILWGISKDRNTKIHLVAAVLVIAAAILLNIPRVEFIIVSILCFLVLCMEFFNNAVEKVIDYFCKCYNMELGRVKDLMAGMVLLIDFFAIVVGVLIFYIPFITQLRINPYYPPAFLLGAIVLILGISVIVAVRNRIIQKRFLHQRH